MGGPLLLDTCAVIWIADDAPVSQAAIAAMDAAHDSGEPVYVSPISAWELGILATRDKWIASVPPERWFETFIRLAGLRLAELSPQILIASSALPGPIHADPVDRILAATARENALTLVTRDPKLLDYAARGYLSAFAC